MFFKLNRIGSIWDRINRNATNENWDKLEKVISDRGLEILSESGFLTWLDENGIKHREEVATFADLPSNDSLNTVRGVLDDNKIYIKKEFGWVPFQTIDISKINKLESNYSGRGVSVNAQEYSHLRVAMADAFDYSPVMNAILEDGHSVILPVGDTHIYQPVSTKMYSKISGVGNLSKLIVKGPIGLNMAGTNGTFVNLSDFEVLGGANDSVLINVEDDANTSPSSAIRWSFKNVKVFGNNSTYTNVTGIRLFGGYIADIYNPIIQGCEIGIDIIRNTISGTSFNSLNVYGGEIQGNKRGVVVEHVLVVNFFGTAIEGNRYDGILIKDGSRMVNLESVYFESNGIDDKAGTSDVNVEVTVWQNSGRVNLNNCNFLKGAYGAHTPIRINRGALNITGGTTFASYQNSDAMIKIDEMVANGTVVTIDKTVNLAGGIVQNNTSKGGGKKEFITNSKSLLPKDLFVVDESGELIMDEQGNPIPSPASTITGVSDGVLVELPKTMSKQGNIVSTFISESPGNILYKYRVSDVETNESFAGEYTVPVKEGYNSYTMNFDYAVRNLRGKSVYITLEREGRRTQDTLTSDIKVVQLKAEIFDAVN